MTAGADLGIAAYGLEAMGMMRVEKGHVAGNEINGQTTARDLGLGKMMSTRKDYIGRALANRPGLVEPDRWGLVGLKPMDRGARVIAGAHLLRIGETVTAANDLGYVTSAAFSPALGHWIGLGLIAGGAARHRPARASRRSAAQRRTRRRNMRTRVLRSDRRAPPWLSLNVQRRSPLAGVAAAGRIGRTIGVAGVGIREITDVSAIAIVARKGRERRCGRGAFPACRQQPCSDAAKRAAGNGLAISGMGPGQWLAMAQSTSRRHAARCPAGRSRWPGRRDGSGRRARGPGGLRSRARATRWPKASRSIWMRACSRSAISRRRAPRTSACRSR